jgi:hypothetical protein
MVWATIGASGEIRAGPESAVALRPDAGLQWEDRLGGKELNMPEIDTSDKQILDSLDRLSPRGRREAVLRLVAGASALDRTVERFQPQIIALAKQRGLDWTRLSDEERERLVDDILHE